MDKVYQNNPNIHAGKPRHKAIAAFVEGPRVLDFGCGTGDLLLLLQDEQPELELTGIDISRAAIAHAFRRGFTGRLLCDDVAHRNGLYDTVVASQVLEHVKDDGAIIKSLANALDENGLLIISVPNDGAVQSPDHKRTYTKTSLHELLECIGNPVLHSWPGEDTRIIMSVRKREQENAI